MPAILAQTRRPIFQIIASLAVGAALCIPAAAQSPAKPTAPPHPAGTALPAPLPRTPISDHDLATTQHELIRLLRLSPTLTTVVARDPSLLSNQDYVSRNNPDLAAFLAAHPEIARNPDFYLFTHAHPDDGSPDDALERAVWPEYHPHNDPWSANDVLPPIAATLAFACFLAAVIWLVRQFLDNRRWSRIFKLQSEVHGRLIDKFSSSQELAAYMETEAGKRFLEAAPIPLNIEGGQRMPNAIARVLTPLQIGVVLVLLGIGFFMLRNVRAEMHDPMLVLGTVALMPGLGFIISAGITWFLAGRLGLMPAVPAAGSRINATSFGSRD